MVKIYLRKLLRNTKRCCIFVASIKRNPNQPQAMKTSATLNQKITAAQIWFNTARETANLIHADILAECAVIRAAAGNPRRLSGGALQLVPQSLRVAHTAAKATECAAQKKLDHLLGVAKRFA